MNRQIRRLGIALLVCYVALFAMLNYWQVVDAKSLNHNPDNTRTIVRDFAQPRGEILTDDGVVLARSVKTGSSTYPYQREYPQRDLYGHLTGWYSLTLGASGVEQQYNAALSGRLISQQVRSLSDLFVDRDRTGDVVLSIRDSVQRVARQALGNRQGSIVALDPRSGAVLAMWSNPSFDPNVISSHRFSAAAKAKTALDKAPGQPLRAHAYQDRYFPGSTFKVVTAGTGLQSGKVTPDTPVYPVTTTYTPPLTTIPVTNFAGEACGGRLFTILAVSCNTSFAQMAAETLGPDIMVRGAESFGFNAVPPIDLPGGVKSVFPTNYKQNLPALAQAGFGQYEVQATPLEMVLAAAAAANGGRIMTPTVMKEIRAADGSIVRRAHPKVWKTPLDASHAATLRAAMINVVQHGTAQGIAIPGVEVGGKTGTAQIVRNGTSTHAWMIAFAGPPGGQPTVAVAVFVKAVPGLGEQTGAAAAGPAAKAVLQAALAG